MSSPQVISPPAVPPGPMRVPIRQIQANPFQPRTDFGDDEIQSLSDSLRAHGLLQPLVVRPAGEGYQLVAGERRLRAAIKAGWSDVPVQVVEADDRQMAELALSRTSSARTSTPWRRRLHSSGISSSMARRKRSWRPG